jgi:ADP-ribosyl-[dinitrogen reductase] hydrolase
MAANLGDDADTVAAVTGQIAGAMHGLSAIPPRWVERLHASRRLLAVAEALHTAGTAPAKRA